MPFRKALLASIVMQPIIVINGIRAPIAFLNSPSLTSKIHTFKRHFSLSSDQIVEIADKITNYEVDPLPSTTRKPAKNIYTPGQTFNIDYLTLKAYSNELSTLLSSATCLGVSQISQQRLHAIFLHFRDKWKGASRLLIFHPNKFFPPIYLGSKVAVLYMPTKIAPTYLEDTLNVLKTMTLKQIICEPKRFAGLSIDLEDRSYGNSTYRLTFASRPARNNLTIKDITDGSDRVIFNSEDWIFPEKKRQLDKGEMLKKRVAESKKLYHETFGEEDTLKSEDDDEALDMEETAEIDETTQGSDALLFMNKKTEYIPIAKLMNQSIPGLSIGTAVDMCRSLSIPETTQARDVPTSDIHLLIDKIKNFQNFDISKISPRISNQDEIYYYNVHSFSEPNQSAIKYDSAMEMLHNFFESSTIPYLHKQLSQKADDLCKSQLKKLENMIATLNPVESATRISIIEEKIALLKNYTVTIKECQLFTTMDSYKMLLGMVKDMEELTSSKCTGAKDSIKVKARDVDVDGHLYKLAKLEDKGDKQVEKTDSKSLFQGLLSVKCLVDDPDSPFLVIGRNANQNEKLVNSIGNPSDLWFHASHVPGAHVLLKNYQKLPKSVAEKVIQFAADTAAYFSKAKGGRKSYTVANVKHAVGENIVDVTMANFSDVVKEEGMEMGAVLVKSGKIIKASPRRARKKVEDVMQHNRTVAETKSN